MTLIQADESKGSGLKTLQVSINQNPFQELRNIQIVFQNENSSKSTDGVRCSSIEYEMEDVQPRFAALHSINISFNFLVFF